MHRCINVTCHIHVLPCRHLYISILICWRLFLPSTGSDCAICLEEKNMMQKPVVEITCKHSKLLPTYTLMQVLTIVKYQTVFTTFFNLKLIKWLYKKISVNVNDIFQGLNNPGWRWAGEISPNKRSNIQSTAPCLYWFMN